MKPASTRDIDDAALAGALIAGEGWALAEVWRRFAPMVLTMAARALGSRAEADDLAQEVFQRVFRKASTLREPSALRSFVFSFAVRVLKTELRARKARAWLSFHRSEVLPDVGSDLVDLEARDVLRRFYGLLDRLSARDRLVFALRHMERMTVEEVAGHTDLSISTVKRSLSHATDKLALWVESDLGLAGFLSGRIEP
ncbi:MAG TPA: sigma-70 family RNA polymerase sigma factor [Polyangia bacterium]|nr:sigma-70 family RNA polymerase sigma factor [Polyangia bacterium]